MADTEKFKKKIRAGRVPGVAGPKRQLMQKMTRVEDDGPKYHRYGFRSVDDEGSLKPVSGLYHTLKYDQKGKPKPTGKSPSKKGDKPLYGYKGTDNPVAKKKKPKKKIPKTKKRIKGTLRDNLPIFGGPGQVPEG